MKRLLQVLFIAALVLGAAWYVLRALRPAPVDPDMNLNTALVESGNLIREVRIVGSVTPVLLTQIKSEVGGRVVQVHVENGQVVS